MIVWESLKIWYDDNMIMIGMGILIDDHILSDSHSSQIPPSYQSGAELNRKVGAFINIYNSNFTWVYVRYTYTFHSGWWLYTNGPGHFRNLNRRYLPYIRTILYKAYVREYPHKIWPEIWYWRTFILGSWNSHWLIQTKPDLGVTQESNFCGQLLMDTK